MMATSSEAERVFERVRTQLKARLGGEVYSSWFGRMKLAEASKGVIRLSVPTAFLKSWINGHYLDLIAELWRQEEPELLRAEIVVRSATRQSRPIADNEPEPARKPARPVQTALGSGTIPSTAGALPSIFSRSPATCFRSTRARSTPPCGGWRSGDGSGLTGAPRRTTGGPGTTS